MTISDVYQKYYIMPSLERHMFRVAGVAMVVAEELVKVSAKLPQPFTRQDLHDVVTASLLHDMGNLSKFDLEYFPEFVQPEGLEHWQKVQAEFWLNYGKNAHVATLKILDEIEVSDRVKELVNAVSFNKAKKNLDSSDYAAKLCAYADMRVDPHGVVSMDDRLADGQKRYQPDGKGDRFIYAMAACLRKIEKQLFDVTTIVPSQITNESVEPFFEEFSRWEI